MHRRRFLQAAVASPFAYSRRAWAAEPIYIADMHSHLFFFGRHPAASRPLGQSMAEAKATLVAWSLVGDLPWIRPTPQGLKQTRVPAPGEPLAWLHKELARIKQHIAGQNLKIALTAHDIDLALAGDPHVVLAIEGASFTAGNPAEIQAAYDLGIRHIQLVHYIKSPLADLQTERPEHNGLSEAGKRVVQECNRLGILVDLAHAPSAVVMQALEVSRMPMVWSHSSVSRGRTDWSMPAWKARQLPITAARAIAAKGGVIGLWGLQRDVGPTIEGYADRLWEMSEWLGGDHVAFGSDMNGVVRSAIGNYADLRRVVDYWQQHHKSDAQIRKIAIGNYARVLRQAIAARQA